MLSVFRQDFPRTTSSHLNDISYEDGRSKQKFFKNHDHWTIQHTIAPTTTQHGPSFMAPPLHYHMNQIEKFNIQFGTGRFFSDGTVTVTKAGDYIEIPAGAFHRFENASEDGEDLVVDVNLVEEDMVMDQRFFRNFLGYIDDSIKAKQQPSFFQLCLFLYTFDCPVVLPFLGEKSTALGRRISWVVMFIAGVIVGEWLLGYRRTYPEYYRDTAVVKKLE